MKSAILVYQCLAQLPPEKLPPGTMGINKDPHPDIIQRVRDLEPLSPKREDSIKTLPSGFRKPFRRGGRKTVRARSIEDKKKKAF